MARQKTYSDTWAPPVGHAAVEVERWLPGGMRPAPIDSDEFNPDLPLGRRLRLGALIAVLATGCYAAVACGLAIFILGAALTAQNVVASLRTHEVVEAVSRRVAVPMPSQYDISREHRSHLDGRGTTVRW